MTSWMFFLQFLAPQYEARIAVEAAYIVVAAKPEDATPKCCGLCKGGKITHGDGHVTDCACPSTCKCKKTVSVLLSDCKECEQQK